MRVIKEFYADKLFVKTFETRQTMGESAAADVALEIADLLKIKPEINIIFAAAPSQNEFLAALVEHDEIQLVSGKYIYCIVPGKTKAEAVKRTITGEIAETCPATILRKHDHAVLYIDTESASL